MVAPSFRHTGSAAPFARLAIVLSVLLALVAGFSLALPDAALAHSSHHGKKHHGKHHRHHSKHHGSPALLASDDMLRHVSAGLGHAHRGGHYTVSALSGARVRDSSAVLGPVHPGRSVSAWLPGVHPRDAAVSASFHLGTHQSLGGGQYFELGLRRAGWTTSYLAKLRVVPGRYIALSFSRFRNGHETVLGTERPVLPISAASGWIGVEAIAVGSFPVRLGMRVWRAGHAVPSSYQVGYVDRSSARITRPGAVGFTSYLSRSATGTSSVDFRHLRVWAQRPHFVSVHPGPRPVVPPVSTPPTKTPPVSTPPTTGTPPVTTPPSSGTPPVTTPPSTGTPPVTTPPGTSSDEAGAAPIGTASYAVPSNAVFVSPAGSDSAAGTESAPVRTLARGVQIAPSGGTVVMRAGSYNESVTDLSKPLTVQNYPGEAVWLDGSTAVTDWAQQGSTWVHSGWMPQFNSIPSYTSTVSTAPSWGFVSSSHPMAAHPDQMWFDGTALTQVGSADAVGPGRFFADYADHELVIGSNPSGHSVRASNLATGLTSYASHFTVRGIGVRCYAVSVNAFGALRLLAADDAVENVVATQNATTGIMLDAARPTVRNVTVSDNGMLGLSGTYVDGMSVDGLLAENNNTEAFNMSPVSGGMKIARSRVVSVRNSRFVDNGGPGAWFDESVYGATIVGNSMTGNANHGLSYEISSTAVIADNTVANNGGWGLKINDSDHVRVWNNTILNNQAGGVWLAQDTRRGANLSDPGHNPHVAQPDATEPWTITDDAIMNNIITGSGGAHQLDVEDYSHQFSADSIRLQVNGNQFQRGTSTYMIVWGRTSGNPAVYQSAAAFVAGTGQGSANCDVTANPVYSTPAGGVGLPADIAAMLDQPAGTAHMGAF